MTLDCIVTLANEPVRLRFTAMERSLRAVGCDLPLRVIPYDARRFALPPRATWWEEPALFAWLAAQRTHPTMRKYACLMIARYHFVDSDVVFLRDPAQVLRSREGFITSCGHWRDPTHTVTDESRLWFEERWADWPARVFNTGQFACDRILYPLPALISAAEAPGFAATCLRLPFHEQPGVNLLVNASGVTVHNLTRPPEPMQSTWAGDYGDDANYRRTWTNEAATPYLIHWAGCPIHMPRPIDELYLDFLTAAERAEWTEQVAASAARAAHRNRSWRAKLQRWRRALWS